MSAVRHLIDTFGRTGRRSGRAAAGPRGPNLWRAPAWAITDEALTAIDAGIAAHEPERGCALIALAGSRIVVDVVLDPRVGEAVSYWHSPELRERLEAYLAIHPGRRYAGTLHSHPSWLAEPSAQDHVAYSSTLRNNPRGGPLLFPIVVGARRDELEVVERLGDSHLIDLAHGTFAGYAVVADSRAVTGPGTGCVLPAPLHALPIRTHVDQATRLLTSWTGTAVTSNASTRDVAVGGSGLPAIEVTSADGRSAHVVVPPTYPVDPPIVVSRDGSATVDWSCGRDATGDLARALLTAVGGSDHASVSGTGRRELESRLREHLPQGVSARYLIVGAGSVGSNAAELLVRSGVRDLVLVDPDVVELANLSRTTYTASDVGRPKVEALRDSLLAIAPDLCVDAVVSAMQDLDLDVLDAVDVAVLAADDLTAEFWLGHHLYRRHVRSVSIKMFARGDAGELVVVDPVARTPCAHCLVGDVGDGRGATDYGTGRIEAAAALGPDIVATVARGVKVALALGQAEGPLADWLRPMITHGRTYFQQSNVASWQYFTHFAQDRPSAAFDARWFWAPSGRQDCSVCGPDPEQAPTRFGGPDLPDELPRDLVGEAYPVARPDAEERSA